jgi:hypothetical protein
MLKEYLTTKESAERYMMEKRMIRGTVLKPGFIADSKGKPWSVGLKPLLKVYNCLSGGVLDRLDGTRVGGVT